MSLATHLLFFSLLLSVLHAATWTIQSQTIQKSLQDWYSRKKLLIVFAYYVVLAVVALTAFTLIARDKDKFMLAIKSYFECEAKDVLDPNDSCDRSYIQPPYVVLSSLSYILLGLFPVVNFIFVISVRRLKQYIQKWCPSRPFKRPKPEAARLRNSGSQSSSNSSQSSSSSTP